MPIGDLIGYIILALVGASVFGGFLWIIIADMIDEAEHPERSQRGPFT
jgi:glycerol uptake facilitator-like aquaporin